MSTEAKWRVGPKSRRVHDAAGNLIAMVMPAATPAETEARAQLIASAPELKAQLATHDGDVMALMDASAATEDGIREDSAHLLAHQQARGIQVKDSVQHLVTKDTIGEALNEARAEVKRLDAEVATLRAESERLASDLARMASEAIAHREEAQRLREALAQWRQHAVWDPDGEIEDFDTLVDLADAALAAGGAR